MSEELRTTKKRGVLFIESDILYDPNLSPHDKYLYIILRKSMITDKSYSTISYETLKEKYDLSTDLVSDSIKALEKNHYIEVEHNSEGNKYYFREQIERPITVFNNLISVPKAKMHYIAKLICILLYNHHGAYCINDLSVLLGRKLSKNTDENNHLKIAIENSKEHINSYTLGKTVYYYYDHDLEKEYFTASREIKIPSNINEIRSDDRTKTDTIYSDAAITLYAYLCLMRKENQNYAEYYDSYVIESLHLTKSQFSNAIKKLEEKKLISVSGDSKLKKATFKPQESYITIYSDILLDDALMKNDDYHKAISYYITHYNDTDIDSDSGVPALLKPFIKDSKFIDFSEIHLNDPHCSYNIESLIGTDLLGELCSPVGIAASMLRDAILHAEDNAKELYNILSSEKNICFRTLLCAFINQNYEQQYNITRFIYSVREKLSEYTTKTTPSEAGLLNYSLYNNAVKLVINVNSITDNMITATNCHNTTQNNIKIFFDTSEHTIECGKYIVTLKALLTSEGVYEYHLLSCKKYNNEPIYSIDHKLPDNNAILFFDKNPDGLEHNAFSMHATGIALKNAFNLTVPFKASAFFIKTTGYEFNLESISSLLIELKGEYYNLVEGLNICCDDYKIYIRKKKHLKTLLQERIKVNPTIIKAIIPKWKDILVDGIICADKLEAELKVAGVDEKAITKHLSLLEMTRPKALMELIKEIASLEDVMDNQKTQMYKMLYKAIYDDYKCKGIHEITTNPYIFLQYSNKNLIISFNRIDNYACKLGIEYDNPIRLEGILIYLYQYISSTGNVGISLNDCENIIKKLNEDSLFENNVLIEDLKKHAAKSIKRVNGIDYIISLQLFAAEKNIAENVNRILRKPFSIKIGDIEHYETDNKITFDEDQKQAIKAINDSNIVLIQGSAGTGKSFLIKRMIELYAMENYIILTPTGKAAQIYSDKKAATIHRYLGYIMDKGFSECRFNKEKTIPANLIIIDEASMVDIITANALFSAIADGTKVVLVGDQNQLPPVEPGRVFYDIISCGKIKTIELTKIYRTESETIIDNATKILQGKNEFKLAPSEFEIIYKKSNDEIINETEKRAQKLYESEDGNTKQIITTTNSTAAQINKYVEKELLSSDDHEIDWWLENEASDYHIEWRGKKHYLYVGEAVIFQNNDKQKRYVNGQVGIITAVDNTKKTVQISTDKKTTIELNYPELKNIQPAYAITIHKSQGSEYDEVLIAITDEAENLITRELLYTAITRAKKKVTIITSKDVLTAALKNTSKRTTFLASFLKDILKK